MSIIEIIVLAVLGGFAVFGLVIGFLKGAIGAGIRAALVVACVACGVLFNSKITDAVFGININGQPLKELLMGLLNFDTGGSVDPEKIKELLWPIIYIIAQILVCLVSVVALLAVTWLVCGLIDLILKKPLKGKKKFRLIGGLVGLLSGAVVGFSISSLVTGLTPNLYKIYKLEIGDQKVAEMLPVPEDLIEGSGIATFNADNSVIYKVGSVLNPIIYNRVSSAQIADSDGTVKTYTFDGQIEVIKKCADLAGTFAKLSGIDFSSMDSIDNVCDVLRDLDFSDISGEVKETIDVLLDTVIDAVGLELPAGAEINTETLQAINFDAIADVLETVAGIENGEEIKQEDVTEILGGFLEKNEGSDKNTIDVINTFGLDLSSYTDNPDAADMFNSSLDDLKAQTDEDGNPKYTEEDINSLKTLFFGSAV